jgi:hypothetical protein
VERRGRAERIKRNETQDDKVYRVDKKFRRLGGVGGDGGIVLTSIVHNVKRMKFNSQNLKSRVNDSKKKERL